MLYEVITSFVISEQEGSEEVKYELIREDSSKNGFEVSLEVTTPIYSVITSYSIHYTKLYDFS